MTVDADADHCNRARATLAKMNCALGLEATASIFLDIAFGKTQSALPCSHVASTILPHPAARPSARAFDVAQRLPGLAAIFAWLAKQGSGIRAGPYDRREARWFGCVVRRSGAAAAELGIEFAAEDIPIVVAAGTTSCRRRRRLPSSSARAIQTNGTGACIEDSGSAPAERGRAESGAAAARPDGKFSALQSLENSKNEKMISVSRVAGRCPSQCRATGKPQLRGPPFEPGISPLQGSRTTQRCRRSVRRGSPARDDAATAARPTARFPPGCARRRTAKATSRPRVRR